MKREPIFAPKDKHQVEENGSRRTEVTGVVMLDREYSRLPAGPEYPLTPGPPRFGSGDRRSTESSA
jgi:hypothetical protein